MLHSQVTEPGYIFLLLLYFNILLQLKRQLNSAAMLLNNHGYESRDYIL